MKNKTLALSLPILALSASIHAGERPNVILILSDDMGYSDLGCYGGTINTPNLDKLADKGLQYMQFYNTARSCPSRASLITGLHPHQTGIGHMTNNRGVDGYRGDLNNQCVTIAEVLKSSGYETFAVGKWHMTRFMKPDGPKHGWPLQRGFDHYYGTISGAGSFFDPNTLCRGNTYITPENDPEYKPETFYYTNAITDNAIQFLEKRDNPEEPFFMYMAYTAAHWPMQALEEDYEPYIGKFDEGWAKMRSDKYQKMIKAGLIDASWNLGVDPTVPSWDALSTEGKAFERRCMEVYAGMVSNMDKNIGRMVKYLESTGQLENTMIIFLQDNGGCAEDYGRDYPYPYNITVPAGAQVIPMGKDELQEQSIPYRTRDGRPVRCGSGTMAGPADTYLSYGKGWASLSNTPFKEYKRWVHEGGIATPLLIHHPKVIGQNEGQKRWQPGQLPDLMATIVDATSSEYPKTFNGENITPCEGISLLPSFTQDNFNYERPMFWEHEGNRAIRLGKWKLVYKAGSGSKKEISINSWELNDLETDRGETKNLASTNQTIVKDLAQKWDEFANRCQVRPWPDTVIPADDKTYKIIDFENGFPGRWGTNGNGKGLAEDHSWFRIVDNPLKNEVNNSDKVAEFRRVVNGQWWGYAWFEFDMAIMDTKPKYLHIMVNKPVVSAICAQLKDQHANTSSNSGEITSNAQTKTNTWEDIVFKIDQIGDYCYFEFKPDFVNQTLSSRLSGDITIYFDEIVMNNDPEPRKSITSSSKYSVADAFKIYPTVTHGILNISRQNSNPAYLEVYDPNGSLIKQQQLESLTSTIDLSIYNPGLYLINISEKEGFITRKIVKL